jgi:hypothetical protein
MEISRFHFMILRIALRKEILKNTNIIFIQIYLQVIQY